MRVFKTYVMSWGSEKLQFLCVISRITELFSFANWQTLRFVDDSLDENIIDFESRKVKERRAYEEVLSGKYRQPNLIASEDDIWLLNVNLSKLWS